MYTGTPESRGLGISDRLLVRNLAFPGNLRGTQFEDYVNTWLKIKQEASGWPEWVGDDEEKRQQ